MEYSWLLCYKDTVSIPWPIASASFAIPAPTKDPCESANYSSNRNPGTLGFRGCLEHPDIEEEKNDRGEESEPDFP